MKLKKDEKQLLFLGFSLINIQELENRIENERDSLVLEIMTYFKKNVAFIISEISNNYLIDFIKKNQIILGNIKKPYIDFIVGSVIISNILSQREIEENSDKKVIEKFLYITALYYDMYSHILNEIEDDKELLELYKNSFDLGNKLSKKLL